MNSATVASLRKTSLALAVLAVFCTGSAMATSANPFVAVAHTARLQSGDALAGSVPASQPIHIEVVLKLRDRDGLDRFITDNAKSPVQHPMSHDQFMANHAPTQMQAQAVASYLEGMGYRNIVIAPNRLLVSADGTTETASRAFMTNIEQVKTHDGRIAFMNTSDALIPAALQDNVLAVLGLQTVNQFHVVGNGSPQGVHMNAVTQGVHTNTVTPHNPLEFSSIYGGASVATGAGVDVGLFVHGNLTGTLTDLAAFATNNSLARITTSVVGTNGGGGSDTSGRLQWDTNSQGIVGAAGGKLHSLIFYTIPSLSDANVIANFNTIVSANVAKIIDVPIGGCETDANTSGTAASTDEILATGVAQGQTFAIAGGDAGNDACGDAGTYPITTSWPASSQYAIAVGGTTLDASTTTWSSETAWSNSGGGPSMFEPQPSWQTGNAVWDTFRSVPDVAFDADPASGATIVFNGGTQTQGGTTLAASIFSGLWARVLAVKGKSFGFAGPLLYKLSPLDRHDITSGNNGYPATAYWDYTSGMGSLILNTTINDIGNPDTGVTQPVPSFNYSGVGLRLAFGNATTLGTFQDAYFDFDDGSSFNSMNENGYHTFPGVGTYNVTLTVYDKNHLNPASVTRAVVVGTNGQVRNTGFETGTTPWTFSTPGLLSNIQPHGGQWVARLGGTGKTHTDSIKQSVSLAVNGDETVATLTFWLKVNTAETTTTNANDTLAVSITNRNGGVLGTVHTYSNLDANTGYVEETLDLSPFMQTQSVYLRFVATENNSLPTTFLIDDVRIIRKAP